MAQARRRRAGVERETSRFRRVTDSPHPLQLCGKVASVAQRIESVPSKDKMEVRFPPEAPSRAIPPRWRDQTRLDYEDSNGGP